MLTSKKIAKVGDEVLVFSTGDGTGSRCKVEAVSRGALLDAADHIAENDGKMVGIEGRQYPLFDALTPEQRDELYVGAWAEWPGK